MIDTIPTICLKTYRHFRKRKLGRKCALGPSKVLILLKIYSNNSNNNSNSIIIMIIVIIIFKARIIFISNRVSIQFQLKIILSITSNIIIITN